MKKRILLTGLLIVLVAALSVGLTLAYLTATDSETNVVTIGKVDAELYESQYHRGSATGYLSITGQPNPTTDKDIIDSSATYKENYLANATLKPFDLSNKNQAMFEACTVAKNAYVKNTGNNDCFVRVTYMIPADIAQYLDIFYVNSQFITADSETATADATTLDNGDKTEPIITEVTYNGANAALQIGKTATVGGKEYYVAEFIYAERLTPNEMTLYSPISKITMVPTVTEEIIASLNLTERKFDIVVKAEVIQADGFLTAVDAFAAF